jgi:hypothetical protein
MGKKPKFEPLITRIELNPEQSVLYCIGYDVEYSGTVSGTESWTCCFNSPKRHRATVCSHQNQYGYSLT